MLAFANPCHQEKSFASVGVFEDDTLLLNLSEPWADFLATPSSDRIANPDYDDEHWTNLTVEAAWDL
jgi:hypothetical protein